MGTYILSTANRFYVGRETAFGVAAPLTADSRFPAVRMAAHQTFEASKRHDKTGTRTFLGPQRGTRRATEYQLETYLTSWNGVSAPSYGALFEAALGSPGVNSTGLVVSSAAGPSLFSTTMPHGLLPGSGVSVNNELRFVSQVPDPHTVALNAPLASTPAIGTVLSPSVTYRPATNPASLTLFDCWDASAQLNRLIVGATVDTMDLAINGDYHEFAFRGAAADLLDAGSFVAPAAGLTGFPLEPTLAPFDYSIVPGHLGEAWIGSSSSQSLALMEAKLHVRNNIDLRNGEFGSLIPRSFVPGPRVVSTGFTVAAQNDGQTAALYATARQRSPISVMWQLGASQGQLMGIYMPNVIPELPLYMDNEPRLLWHFENCLAQGLGDDEIFIAFA